jgi:hypothetical protein
MQASGELEATSKKLFNLQLRGFLEMVSLTDVQTWFRAKWERKIMGRKCRSGQAGNWRDVFCFTRVAEETHLIIPNSVQRFQYWARQCPRCLSAQVTTAAVWNKSRCRPHSRWHLQQSQPEQKKVGSIWGSTSAAQGPTLTCVTRTMDLGTGWRGAAVQPMVTESGEVRLLL